MRKHTELRLEAWTVIVAVLLVGLIGFMLSRMGGMSPMATNQQQMMRQFMDGIDKARGQVDTALTHADEALKAADVSTVQKHVGFAMDALAGQGGAKRQMQMMQDMMAGPMMSMAMQGMAGMSMEHHSDMMAAMQAVQSNMTNALEHFKESLMAETREMAQEHVRLAKEQLQAAKGSSSSNDPKSGGLTYMKELIAQMMGQMKH